MSKDSIIKELWGFFLARKKWWLIPIFLLLLLLGGLMFVAQSTSVAPFIYAIF